ncbi:unnamed protein product [Dibothriocephalus latus]|uniref:Uncharacterized protein n=1 Tax=Dibothriocephalus latus TaxID=60516 RepID=A0A3P7MUU8_DIBLA|nr:unnamed protein product [Dibothriocephalus latus]
MLSVLPAEPTTEHNSGGSRNSPPAASPATSRETSNSCGKVSPVSRGNSSSSLLEEVLNAPSTKSQLSSLLGDEPTTPIKSLASGGPSSGNGIKKELLASPPLSRLLVSKDGEAKLSTKRDQVVYPASMVNGTGYSAETDPMHPKRPKMSPNSVSLFDLDIWPTKPVATGKFYLLLL